MLELFITRSEFCAKLNVCAYTARRWEIAKKLTPFTLTTGCVRYRITDVERLLTEAQNSKRRKPGPKPRQRHALNATSSQ